MQINPASTRSRQPFIWMMAGTFLFLFLSLIQLSAPAQNVQNPTKNLLLLADSFQFSNPDLSLEYAFKAFEKATADQDSSNIAMALNYIGTLYYYKGKYEISLQHHLKSLTINELLKDTTAIAKNYNNMAMVLQDTGKDSAALYYYQKAAAINIKDGNTSSLLNAYNNIGSLFAKTELHDSTLKYFGLAASMAESGNPLYEGAIKHNMGMIYLGRKEYKTALRLFNESLLAHKKANSEMGAASNLLYIGETHMRLKDFDQGLSNLVASAEIAEKHGFKLMLSEAWLKISQAYENAGNPKPALDYYKKWAKVWQEVFDEKSARNTEELRTRYESEKKEKENQLLARQNVISALEISRQQAQRNMLLGLLAALLITVGLVYNRYRIKQKNRLLKERELRAFAVVKAQENEKIRLSRELHDGIGPLFSLIKLNVSAMEPVRSNTEAMESTKELASTGMREVRTIAHSLMPGTLIKSGLPEALNELTNLASGSGLTIRFQNNLNRKIAPETEINLYRIVQEAVNNIIRHAEARTAEVSLAESNQKIRLSIQDDGKGFDPEDGSAGNGLNNIRSRVDMMMGRMEISSRPSGGTRILIILDNYSDGDN